MATVNKIVSENLTLLSNPIKSFLTADTASAVGTLTVKSIIGFAVNQVLIIGELGNEGTEIIKTHASTAPSGTTITLAANTLFPHSSGTPVYIIDFDQLEVSTATTVGGSKTVLATIAIQVDNDNTIYTDSTGPGGFYFTRFKNTITSTFSAYSAPIPVTGYTILTARSIIDNALGMINKMPSNLLTDQYSYQQINNCQMEVLRELKRWSFMQVFDFNLGQLTTGQWKVAMPTNIDDTFSNKSIYNFRIGTLSNLFWIDKEKWNEIVSGISHTTLANNINVSDATITLTDASDFPDAGSVYIGANIYQYTAVNRTTNVLTLSVVSTTTNTATQDVFSGASFGMPQYWTTWGGNIQFYPILGATYNQRDGHLDYYTSLTQIVDDSDLTVLPDPSILQYYLAWKLILRQQAGRSDATSEGFRVLYETRVAKLKQKEVLGRTFKLKPILNNMNMNNDNDGRNIRGGNFPNTNF